MTDENYTEAQSFEASHEAVEQETAEALADGQALEVVEDVVEEVAAKEAAAEEVPAGDAPAEDGAQDEAAPASAEEEAIAKLRRKLYMSPGDWYVIHTYSGHERK